MRRLLILMILTGMLLSSCSAVGDISDKIKSPSYPENETTAGNEEESGGKVTVKDEKDYLESEELYESFMKLVNGGKEPFELITFIDKEIGKVSVDRADDMILALEEVQSIYENYYQQKFFSSNFVTEINNAAGKGIGTDIVDRMKDKELISLVRKVFNGGFKLISLEGSVYPIVDYAFAKKYEKFVSVKAADYMAIRAMESDKRAAADGALVISWDELAQRLLKIEAYISTHKDFLRIEKLENVYYNYMMMYLVGLNNTPAYDYDTKVYKNEVRKSFNDLISKHKDSRSAGITASYLDIIKGSNYAISEKAREFTTNLYNENISPEGKFSRELNFKYTNAILTKLIPEKTGYKWVYNGFAEYGHEMILEEINKDDEQIKYIIKGKVADMSDGESGKSKDYFNIDLVYTIKDSAIVQTKSENIMMDSDFNSLELIKAPLIQGNKWMQAVVDKSGKSRYLDCEITNVNEVGSSKVYTVKYKDMDSDYYEIRMIEEGVGIVHFAKLWQTEEEGFEIGYGLYKDASGY